MLVRAEHAAIVRAILLLSQALGLEVTAEGVETREQFDLLAALGCDAVQGYLISRPISEDALIAMLESNRQETFAA
jgi:EAL domain-containing protein (putative c-di-GMP-specific phosphodiesterase class I)